MAEAGGRWREEVGKRGWGAGGGRVWGGWSCQLRSYLALTVDLGPSVDKNLYDLQVAKPGRQEKCIHPKLGERTQGGEEKGRRQRSGCVHRAKPFIL